MQALREKYVEMKALREMAPSTDVRPRLRALAERFPGALREIDELPIAEIHRRIALLDRVNEGAAPEPWMAVTARFHALARGALRAKKWLGSRRKVDDAMRTQFCSAHTDDEARDWAEQLASIAAPVGGRITRVVMDRLAGEQDLSLAETQRLVRPHARIAR